MYVLCPAAECHCQVHVSVADYFRWCDHHKLLTPSGAGQLAIIELTYLIYLFVISFEFW